MSVSFGNKYTERKLTSEMMEIQRLCKQYIRICKTSLPAVNATCNLSTWRNDKNSTAAQVSIKPIRAQLVI